jgi:phenylacetate-CoA ligase
VDRLTRLNLLWQLFAMRRRRSWTRPQIRAYQSRELSRLRAYTYARSEFYRRFHAGLMDQPLAELPVLTKTLMMQHFDELVTDPTVRRADVERHVESLHVESLQGEERLLGRYVVTATSGSSGLRGLFLHDRAEFAAIAASIVRSSALVGTSASWLEPRRFAVITSREPSGLAARTGSAFQSRWTPVLHMDTREPLDSVVERLNNWQPHTVATFASMAAALAEEQLAGRLRISPSVVAVGAEVLTQAARNRMEAAWGKKVFNRYTTTETGNLASECVQHRGMHLLDDLVIVELVDGDNRPVGPGVYSEKVLITTLFRHTQPLIRYELSDLMRLSSELCHCGRSYPLIDDVQGRVWEVLYFSTPDGGQVAVQPLLLNNVLEPVPAQWQVVQEPEGLRILLSNVRGEVDEGRLVDEVQRALVAQGAVAPPVRVQRVSTIPRSAGGKAPLIRSTVPRAGAPAE